MVALALAALCIIAFYQYTVTESHQLKTHLNRSLTVTKIQQQDAVKGFGKVISLNKQFIAASESGRVNTLHVRQGQRVEVGSPLYRIDNRLLEREAQQATFSSQDIISDVAMKKADLKMQRYRFQAALLKAQSHAKGQQLELAANKQLSEYGIVSKVKFEQIKLATGQALREVDDAQAQLTLFNESVEEQIAALNLRLTAAEQKQQYYADRLASLNVIAEKSGVIESLNMTLGQSITIGDTLMEIVDNSVLHAEIQIPQYSLNRVALNNTATIKLPTGSVTATVDFIDPIVRDGASVVRLAIADQNSNALNLHQSIEAEINTNQAQQVASISLPADFQQYETWLVYHLENGRLIRTDIRLSLGSQDNLVLTPSLAEGEQVVLLPSALATKNQYLL